MLQSLNYLHSPSQDTLQSVHVFLVLGSPELNPALQMFLTTDDRAEGSPSGNILLNKAQDAVCPYLPQGTSLAHVPLYPPGPPDPFSANLLLSWLALSLSCCMGLFTPRPRTRHLPLLSWLMFLSAQFSSMLRSLWIAAHCFGVSTTPPHFVCKLAENALCTLIQVNEDAKWY